MFQIKTYFCGITIVEVMHIISFRVDSGSSLKYEGMIL